jgi:hypothetical protein
VSLKQADWIGVVVVTTLELGSGTALGQQPIDSCGTLTVSAGCNVFQADTGGAFVLDQTGGFGNGDRVHVVGQVDTACLANCLGATACIVVTTIEPCGGQFSGCGTLIQDGTCVLFQSDSGGTFVLDQTQAFVVGDRVQVVGTLDPSCATTCSPSDGCITVGTLETCATQFTACGTLIQRGACVDFLADRGGTFSLETTGGFAVGDRVSVSGVLDSSCVPPCQPADGCIAPDTIQVCGGLFSECGTLVQGSGCIVFQADTGATYDLNDTGQFVVGDRVLVTGTLGGSCLDPCSGTGQCIADNTIALCQGSFSGCGKLTQGAACVLFQADSGGSFALDTTNGLAAGTRVFVSGTRDPTCTSTCLAANGCIRNNTISTNVGSCSTVNPTVTCPTTTGAMIALSVLGLFRSRCVRGRDTAGRRRTAGPRTG